MSLDGSNCLLKHSSEVLSDHNSTSSHDEECTDVTRRTSIGSFPSEVLSDVFFWCCQTYNDHFRGPPSTVLNLSHVCKSWRTAAFETPGLWTYLKLGIAYSADGGMEKAYEQIHLWLARAQNYPVFIDAEMLESPQRPSADNVFLYVMKLVDVTLADKEELISSEMELSAALDASSVSPSLDGIPHILEQYTWVKSDMRPDRPIPGTVQIQVSRRSEIVFGLEGHAMLGSHLIHLDLRDPDGLIRLSVEECQIALSNFPALQFCAMRIGESTDEVAEPLVLMHLRTLSLSWNDGVEIAALLDSMTAPSLNELELHGPLFPREYFPGNRWTHLRDFLRRSSPQLMLLTLAKMDCTTLDFIHCIALCEGLLHLSLEECQLDEEFMDSLQWQDEDDRIHDQAIRTLKSLDFLSLISCDVFALDDYLRSCAEPQLWLDANLSRLYIIDCGHISEDVLAALRDLPLERFETTTDLLDDGAP